MSSMKKVVGRHFVLLRFPLARQMFHGDPVGICPFPQNLIRNGDPRRNLFALIVSRDYPGAVGPRS